MIRKLVLIFLLQVPILIVAQFRHMHYNLTLYGNPFSCDEINNNTDEKDAALDIIVDYAQPDILTVNEIRDQTIWAERILNNVLNDDEELWARASLTGQFTSSSILNALFYRADKFVLQSQEVVDDALDGSSLLRPIDIYHLYAIDQGLEFGDTTFVSAAVAHLAASDEEERSDQTEALMQRIEELGPRNYIFTGDLNMDSSLEEAFQNLISHPYPDIAFLDPISVPSTWNNNPSVAQYHTQSTRFGDTNNGCFSGGGLDDRFDITLISPSVETGASGVTYIAGSYEVLGQNGNDYNQELQTFNNGAVPDIVAQALYEMSDHLPVLTDYSTDFIISTAELDRTPQMRFRNVHSGIQVWLSSTERFQIELIDVSGKLITSGLFQGAEENLLSVGHPGIYLLRLQGEQWIRTVKVFID